MSKVRAHQQITNPRPFVGRMMQVCYNSATALLGWSSSFLFVERTFPPARRASTIAMLDRRARRLVRVRGRARARRLCVCACACACVLACACVRVRARVRVRVRVRACVSVRVAEASSGPVRA